MKMSEFIAKLFGPTPQDFDVAVADNKTAATNFVTNLVDVGETLKQLKSIKDRLELAKKQQAEIVAQAECNKLQNEVVKEERIRLIEDEHTTLNHEEDLVIGIAEDEIEEAEQWLAMFPTKK